jgi:hypothetical protein
MSFLRPQFQISAFLRFSAVFGVFLALFHASGVDRGFGQAAGPASMLFPMGMAFVFTCVILLRGAATPRCEACGRKYAPLAYARNGTLCPSCPLPKLAPDARRRAVRGALLAQLSLFLMLGFVVLWPLSSLLELRHGWLAYPALALGLFVVLFMLYFCGMVLRTLIGSRRMSNLGHALKVARTCAGEPGRTVSLGSSSVYVFARNDPAPMLAAQIETCRRRFEELVGGPVDAEHPLRIFAFGKRMALEGFCRSSLLNAGNLDGLFVPWSARTIALTSEFPAYRLGDPERVARVLLSYFYLDTFKKGPLPLWVQTGVASLIAGGEDVDELARLNRKMTAALARGDVLGTAELFHAPPQAFVRLLKDWQEFASFSKYQKLVTQSWSVIEYLCGREATNDQRQRFRGFLTELKPKTPQEEVFKRHFNYGFDVLLDRWRAWVLDRGLGSHVPPPEHLRHALLGRVIPIVLDREAEPLDRIQAIRDLGRTGYVLGADALVDVLENDAQIPHEEAVWSLEAISGQALGNASRRWADEWLASLPEEVTGLAKMRG